jgi:Raf kinase inhibitor-like YbhB/YbcL family protein
MDHLTSRAEGDNPGVRGWGPALAVVVLLSACGGGDQPNEPLPRTHSRLPLKSPAFSAGGTLPKRFTCDGEGVSPPLTWSGVPDRARELALIVEDPDAQHFVHWTVLRVPPTARGVGEDSSPRGSLETANSFGKRGWGAPCPPKGDKPHRYVFALYATDTSLGLDQGSSPDEVRRRLVEHAIASGSLTARFGRR